MIKILFRLAFFAAAGFTSHAGVAQGYSIEGSIRGVAAGMARLQYFDESKGGIVVLDSAELVGGNIGLKGRIEGPRLLSVYIEPGGWTVPVFIENRKIMVTGDTTGSEAYDRSSYNGGSGRTIKQVAISGSASNDQYMAWLNAPGNRMVNAAFADLITRYNAENDPVRKEEVRMKFDSVLKIQTTVQKAWIDSFVMAQPSSVAGVYLLNRFYSVNPHTSIGFMDSVIERFRSPATASLYFQQLSQSVAAQKAFLPGNVAPDFVLRQRDGSLLRLSSLQGKVTLIDFWASWCGPCLHAIPHWKEVYAEHRGDGLEIVSVADDHRRESWIKAMDTEKMPWKQVIDSFPGSDKPASTLKRYLVQYIPFYVLLDRKGKILLCSGDEALIDEKISEVLGRSKPTARQSGKE